MVSRCDFSSVNTKYLFCSIQYSCFITRLSNYNYKSSKFNKSVNLFKKVFQSHFQNSCEMALGSYLYHSLYRNTLINLGNNQLVGNTLETFIKSSNSSAPISKTLSYDSSSSLVFALTHVSILDFTFTPNNQIGRYINNDC